MTHTSPETLLPVAARLALLGFLLLPFGGCGGEDRTAPEPQAAPSDTIQLADLGEHRGADDAPVTVVEFSDFGCPYCALFARETLPILDEEFIATGQVRWVFVPFVMGTFPNAGLAVRMAECAGEQNRFDAMKLALYEGQRDWRGATAQGAPEVFARLAAGAGVEIGQLNDCLRTNRVGARVELHNRAAGIVGVRATPTFLVNGRRVEGALPVEEFRMILGRMLDEAGGG